MPTKKPKEAPAVAAQADTPIIAYKGFDANWQCRGMQYKVGETFTHDGAVEACSSGLHACERPLDVLRYYKPSTSRFAIVRATGKISRHGEDSKIAAASLTVEAEIGLPEIISKTIAWTLARCTPAEGAHATKNNESAKTSVARKSATASGDSGAATASGYSGAATASGYSGAATASGDSGAATASGYSGAATASGDSGAATASGNKSSACAPGRNGRARGVLGAALFLTRRDSEWNIAHAWAGIVGKKGIKADTYYTLDEAGQPKEVA